MPLAQQSVLPIWGWSILVIVLVFGGFVVVWWARRRTLSGGGASPGGAQPFTLSDLRAMRDSGAITPEQYHKLRESVIGEARKTPAPGD